MAESKEVPISTKRLWLAFVVAPWVLPISWALFALPFVDAGEAPSALSRVFIGTGVWYLLTLCFAMPVIFVLNRKGWLNVWTLALVNFLSALLFGALGFGFWAFAGDDLVEFSHLTASMAFAVFSVIGSILAFPTAVVFWWIGVRRGYGARAHHKSKKRRTWRRRTIAWVLIGIIGVAVSIAWWMREPKLIGITPGHDTTRLTESLTSGGYVDYLSALQARSSGSGNQSGEWLRLIGSRGVPNFVDPESVAPAELAAVHEKNEEWYKAAISLGPGPIQFVQKQDGQDYLSVHSDLFTIHDALRERFRLRLSHAVAVGNVERVIETLEFVDRLSEQEAACGMAINSVMGLESVDSLVMSLVETAVLGTQEPSDALLQVADRLATSRALNQIAADCMDTGDRYQRLSQLQDINRSRCARGMFSEYTAGQRATIFEHVDWNAALQFRNEFFDACVAALRKDNHAERLVATNQVFKDYGSRYRSPKTLGFNNNDQLTWGSPTERLNIQLCEKFGFYSLVFGYIDRSIDRRRLTRVAISLARFRRENGRFPASIAELRNDAATDGPDEIFQDTLGRDWSYSATESGFRVWQPDGVIDRKLETGEVFDVNALFDPMAVEWPRP